MKRMISCLIVMAAAMVPTTAHAQAGAVTVGGVHEDDLEWIALQLPPYSVPVYLPAFGDGATVLSVTYTGDPADVTNDWVGYVADAIVHDEFGWTIQSVHFEYNDYVGLLLWSWPSEPLGRSTMQGRTNY